MAEATYPDDLKYHAEHDWARIDGDSGDTRDHLVRPGLPRRGRVLRSAGGRPPIEKDAPYAEVESVKAVSDVVAPLSGEIVEVNEASPTPPRRSTRTPTSEGWMVKVRLSDVSEVDTLMSATAYQETLT